MTPTPEPPMPDERAMANDETLLQLIYRVCKHRGWSLHWTHRSAYLHLEAAELAEARRGKRGIVLDEAADVLVTMLALSQCELDDVTAAARKKMQAMLTKPRYAGEETSIKEPTNAS